MPHVHLAILLALLAGCGACGSTIEPPPAGPPPASGLHPYDQERATVQVIACDQMGSGVIVSKRHVVTALHVVGGCGLIIVKLQDGTVRLATLELAHVSDLARLVILDGEVPEFRPSAAGIGKGEIACATTGYPARARECGVVKSINGNRMDSGDVRYTGKVVKGNSGSPVWSATGSLVGILVQCDLLHPDSTEGKPKCAAKGGGFTSIDSVRWLVEDVQLR